MYLHLGQNEIIPQRRILGIFDLDKCSYEKRTRDYLAAAEKEGVVLDISGDLPRSFVVCDHPYHPSISALSPSGNSIFALLVSVLSDENPLPKINQMATMNVRNIAGNTMAYFLSLALSASFFG